MTNVTTRPCIIEGCKNTESSKGLCHKHYQRLRRHGDPLYVGRAPRGEAQPYLDDNGYRVIPYKQDHPNSWNNGRMFEHVYVMSEHLGRALLPDENVHHKNGDRSDNRLENLELWSTSQPIGQRIEDKVAWAKELLRLYDPEYFGE